MIRLIKTTRRKTTSTPFFREVHLPSQQYQDAFYRLYIEPGKFQGAKHIVSEDLLEHKFITQWNSEESLIEYMSETNQHMSDFFDLITQYCRDHGLIEYTEIRRVSDPAKISTTTNQKIPQSFYNQPHVFVVFRPGTGGNFISNLIDNLMSQSLSDVKISSSGHVHYNSIVERKRSGIDHLSCGSGLPGMDIQFFSPEEKINYFKKKIDMSDYQDKPYITWTHSFDNIPVYKSLFPNCRIMVINDDTLQERLTSLIMNINKNHFSSDSQTPFLKEDKIRPTVFKIKIIANTFSRLYQSKEYQSGHIDLDMFLMYSCFLRIHGLEKYTGMSYDSIIPYEDTATNTELNFLESNAQFSIGRQFISQCDSFLNFRDILTKSAEEVIESVEIVMGRSLDNHEVDYIKLSLDKYVDSQNSVIVNDPLRYIASIKEKADTIVSAFKNKSN